MNQHLVANGYACAPDRHARAPVAREHELQHGTLAEQTVGQPRLWRAQRLAFKDEAL